MIQIEMRLDGSMPAGVATGPSGAVRDFTGWVGLMAAVDALTAAAERGISEASEWSGAEHDG